MVKQDRLVLYHGSNEEMDELEANDPGYDGSLGYGLYLTTLPEFAAVFGKHLHVVESPVPDELVVNIEPQIYECGQSLTMYTPGSAPFTFEIVDRASGETHRYSVLGDCDGDVRRALDAGSLKSFNVSNDLRDEVRALDGGLKDPFIRAAHELVETLCNNTNDARSDDIIESLVAEHVGEEFSDEQAAVATKLLEAVADELHEHLTTRQEEQLGTEIDLDDLSATVKSHGYSAFYIEGYAPGDEYVIVDDEYLPVRVIQVEKAPR